MVLWVDRQNKFRHERINKCVVFLLYISLYVIKIGIFICSITDMYWYFKFLYNIYTNSKTVLWYWKDIEHAKNTWQIQIHFMSNINSIECPETICTTLTPGIDTCYHCYITYATMTMIVVATQTMTITYVTLMLIILS